MPELGTIVVGYGSLMSGHGIARDGEMRLRGVERVQLNNARRGYGKASIHGDRFAMVLEAIDTSRSITAIPLPTNVVGGAPQALAIEVAADDLPNLAKREGYSARAFAALQRLAAAAGSDPGSYLAGLMWECGGDTVSYRERLFQRLGYTSPHYIPHPIAIGGRAGLIFLAPGREGSGAREVVPVRVQTECVELMTATEVWQRKPTESQLDYIAMCLLGEAHGLRIDDITADMTDDLRERLTDRLSDLGGRAKAPGTVTKSVTADER